MKYILLLLTFLFLIIIETNAQDTEIRKYKIDIDASLSWYGNMLESHSDIAFHMKYKDRSFIGARLGIITEGSTESRLYIGPSYTYYFGANTKGMFINSSIHVEYNKITEGTYYDASSFNQVSPLSNYIGASISSSLGYQFRKTNKNRGFKIKYGFEGRLHKKFIRDFETGSFKNDYQVTSDYKFKLDHWLMFGYAFFF